MPPDLTVEDSPLEMLLKEQGTLQTPVGVFSEQHEEMVREPEQAQFYKQLLPLTRPGAGEQYAFEVDLDKCTGCKACVSACHSLNGLEENETWRDVGTIHGCDDGKPYVQTVTTACHHCVDPACLNGCPVLAYEKDEATGVVYHLDDQCIGCQYCVLKCPYDVPKYSKDLGIVRKCDMCQSRLAEGEAPACVQACPTEAIAITVVNKEETTRSCRGSGSFLKGTPDPEYTLPATRYLTEREVPEDTEAADAGALRPEHAHLPLVFMLVFTQLSVGLFTIEWINGPIVSARYFALLAMAIGLGASVLHLGRPLGAWRAFLGLKRSWLSREIVTFGAFSVFAFAYAADIVPRLSGLLTVMTGLVGVLTSVMIYHDTRRPFWNFPFGGLRFFGTAAGLGAAAYGLVVDESRSLFLLVAVAALVLKLTVELLQLGPAGRVGQSPAKKSARLMLFPLRGFVVMRVILLLAGLVGVMLFPFTPIPMAVVFVVFLMSEIMERVLFFKAVAAPKMPGGVYT